MTGDTGHHGDSATEAVPCDNISLLQARKAILDLLDRRRAEEGDDSIGTMIEHAVIERELADLETGASRRH